MAESVVASENICEFEAKKEIVGDRLQKREDDRLAKIEKKKEERSTKISANENTSYFAKNFSSLRKDLESQIETSDSLDKNKLVDHFDKLTELHSNLQKFLTECTMFLPAYDINKSQDILADLTTRIQEKRATLIPKKKFAFKSKKKQGAEKQAEVKQDAANGNKDDDVILADCKLTDKYNEKLVMREEITKKDVALTKLDSCTVQLIGAPSAIHINKLNNCKIFSGPVSGSIFIRDCKDSVFVVPCQQLRIHTTTNTKFHIHVTSRAIIEDCNTLQFGPYNWTYPTIEEDYKISGLDKSRNNWNDIDDFNWLAADKHSPNWSLLPVEEQCQKWD